MDVRVVRGDTQYLVRWKGYSKGDDTWEKESSLTNCPELVKEFKAAHPGAIEKAKKRKSTEKSPVRPKKKAKTEKPKKQEAYEVSLKYFTCQMIMLVYLFWLLRLTIGLLISKIM